ncbi:MAG: 2-oxoglutarate dehydrogenase complex dihydrolipoyllysine-residue succinyltransferase [Fimbriiglobus sp.]
MPVERIVVPSLGDSVTEAKVAKWLVANGAAVKLDTPLIELETDKVGQTIAAPAAGVLKILVAVGADVKVGDLLGELDPAGVPASTPAPAATAPSATTNEQKVSPAASRILNEKGVSPSSVNGTGPKGVVTKEDATAASSTAVATKPASPAPLAPTTVTIPAANASGRETRQSMSMIRRRIAERLLESQTTTATLTTFNEADMTAIQELRAKYNERFEKKHGVKIGFMSVFVKAAIEALKSFPVVNARIDGQDIVYQNYYDISVAVSTEKGLTVPIIRDADQLGFADIEKKIAELAKRARDGKLTPQDMSGGTFTITNGGIFGSMLSTPILNPPQTAILGMHSIQKRAVVVNDEIVIRPMMYLALSYDHRLIDGREAVQFLVRIKECLEDPERILFGV